MKQINQLPPDEYGVRYCNPECEQYSRMMGSCKITEFLITRRDICPVWVSRELTKRDLLHEITCNAAIIRINEEIRIRKLMQRRLRRYLLRYGYLVKTFKHIASIDICPQCYRVAHDGECRP